MLSPRLLVVAAALAGCATPGALDAPADHPARPDAPSASLLLAADAPAAVAPPDVPAALRRSSSPAAQAAAHGGPDGAHAVPHTEAHPADPSPLADALDAYLALHDALAADRLDAGAADRFAATFDVLVESPPPGDPHFWHMRADRVAAVRAAARALAEATDLDAARAAFGALSAPLTALVEAHGLPEGVELTRHTCGMADVAEGGVWLQRRGPVENPFFGAAMPTCGTVHDEHEGHRNHEGHEGQGVHRGHEGQGVHRGHEATDAAASIR